MSGNKNEEKLLEKIESNWELFTSLVDKVKDPKNKEFLKKLCEEQSERLATCPASTSSKYVGAFAGGLVWYSLEVLKVAKELNKLYDANISVDDLIIASLFHDVGKIGNEEHDYYLPNKSDWHVSKGMFFEINEDLQTSNVHSRSLWWMSHYGVTLSEQAVQSISSLHHMTQQMYSSEVYNVSMLTLILQQSVRAVCVKNKGKTAIFDE
jgi:hypothetical protein